MEAIPILPARLYYPTWLSALLSLALLILLTSFYAVYYYESTKFFCRLSLTYYTLCLMASSRKRPVAFSTKWNIAFATAIMFLFTILIYDSIPTVVRQIINKIRGSPVENGPLWGLILISLLELAQVVACGIIFQRCLESKTWESPIQLNDNNIDIEEAREENSSSAIPVTEPITPLVDTSA